MQRSLRMNEIQLYALSDKALNDNGLRGYLFKRTSENSKWQLRWFLVYHNLLYYFENEQSSRPSGVIFLEGSYCDKIVQPSATKNSTCTQHTLSITYRKEGSKHYELKAESDSECNAWVHAIDAASFSKMVLQKEELEQKHLHLVQIVESEKTARWQYTQQCEELTMEIKKLRAELCSLKKEWRFIPQRSLSIEDESDEIRKIKKVQSFFRGWLCRRRWKQIVQEYISSPHAENMRKRNSLVFRMVEAEEEYMEQLQLLISCFLRPFKMAASSQKPPCNHDEVNSIFLNGETIMFLHQIFLKGLTARMESWPTLVLAECKQKEKFAQVLRRLEEKSLLQGRTLETFLTYPMHQVPRYIITLHELLAHTPHNHVERKSLENAKSKLEELSRQMHDEVSETENIRKNLAIERIIIGGCDILLDVNQVFVRQGNVLQVIGSSRTRSSFRGSFRAEKCAQRQCFLFSNHILLCTRASNGKLHLVEALGRIPLSEATLIEDPSEQFQFIVDDGEGNPVASNQAIESISVPGSSASPGPSGKDYGGFDFKIIWDCKVGPTSVILHLVAPTIQEKAAWTSDISQCIDNVHFNDLFHGAMNDSSSVTMPQSVRNDPRLFKDDVDIRFSRTLNSCKLPQIRYASPERLFERLTDLRFLSIDFLNTFLLTYRVFTDGVTVLDALKKVHYNPDVHLSSNSPLNDSSSSLEPEHEGQQQSETLEYDYSRRISTTSMVSDVNDNQHRQSVVSTSSDTQVQMLQQLQQAQQHLSKNSQHWRLSHRKFEEEQARERYMKRLSERASNASGDSVRSSLSPGGEHISVPVPPPPSPEVPPRLESNEAQKKAQSMNIRSASHGDSEHSAMDDNLKIPHSQSSETLKAEPSSPVSSLSTATSSTTLVGSMEDKEPPTCSESPVKPGPGRKKVPLKLPSAEDKATVSGVEGEANETPPPTPPSVEANSRHRASTCGGSASEPLVSSSTRVVPSTPPANSSSVSFSLTTRTKSSARLSGSSNQLMPGMNYLRVKGAGGKRGSNDTEASSVLTSSSATPRSSFQTDITCLSSARSSFQLTDSPQMSSKAGVVVTSSRPATRRSSTASAASAFAVATAASSNPPEPVAGQCLAQSRSNSRLPSAVGSDLKLPNSRPKRESMISTAATMRVLNVMRHWISKHSQDFDNDVKLMQMTSEFLEELVHNTNLLPAEHKAASQLLQMITKEDTGRRIDLDVLLSPPVKASKETVESLSALEIAEGMTYLDHKIFISIQSGEFLGQAWMKNEKVTKAHHILLMTQRFNGMSRVVGSEILRTSEMSKRVTIIEKWAAVADICRCLHNFNGVLQICAAFTNSSVFRLKKTWDKVCKTSRQTIEKLQQLVSTDGRFRNMREALHRCDPPAIPYLGMYLTDLSFIEEGTPNFTDDGLLNFSKMRMIAHVIREIKHFQQTPYKIEMNPKVINYLLDTSRHLNDDELYQLSLCLEPRLSRLGTKNTPTAVSPSLGGTSPSHYTS
ncbi:Ras-specific guanine nucleotide-releasing factor 2 [Halotydeus destructor]|nr:Ras-specific guanine nucleotide-releasing factor 2 [Halotydeus destructor]